MERADISNGRNCDFISRLSDPILHQILGSLKMEEAVQTCVLSKRWENLWTSLPSLNFHSDYDLFEAHGDDWFVKRKAIFERFIKFVNCLLLRRQPLDLDVFHLFCHKFCPEYIGYESEWVRYAVNHNPRVLHLTLARSLPLCVYTCSSLEELYLYDPRIYPSDQIVNLPKLRKLIICWADLHSNYMKNLLSGCPILKFLRIDACIFRDCVIAHECLKHLDIVNSQIDEKVHLFISAPNLISFFYEGNLSLPYKTTLNMPSLTLSCLMSLDTLVRTSLEGIATCLRFLPNVEFLELHIKCTWDRELSATVLPLELPIFQKLENVKIAFCMFSCIQMVTWILKNSPNLKKLTILQQEGCNAPARAGASRNELTDASSMIASSPCKKLEIVEIKYCQYNKMVRLLVDTLMDGTKEFKNLKIHLSNCKSSVEYIRGYHK